MHNILKSLPEGLINDVKAVLAKGRPAITKKMIKEKVELEEGVESLDEISIKTLSSYKTKAKADPAFEKRKGKISHARKDIMARRLAGIEKASQKISEEGEAEWKEHSDVEHAVKEHVRDNAHKVLDKFGFHKMAENEERTTYARGNPTTGHVDTVTIKKAHPNDHKYADVSEFKSSTGWQTDNDRYSDGGPTYSSDMKKKADIAHHKAEGIRKYHDHIKDMLNYHHSKGLNESVDVDDKNQIDEGYKVPSNYAKIAANKKRREAMKNKANYGKLANEEATLSQEELDFLEQLNFEKELDEARGRPPRNVVNQGFTIHPKTKEKLMHNNPKHMARIEILQKNGVLPETNIEASQHIMQQLQKAKVSMTGDGKVNFHDGTTHKIKGTHAAALIDKYSSLKPYEKEAFQKKVRISHANMMDELK